MHTFNIYICLNITSGIIDTDSGSEKTPSKKVAPKKNKPTKRPSSTPKKQDQAPPGKNYNT